VALGSASHNGVAQAPGGAQSALRKGMAAHAPCGARGRAASVPVVLAWAAPGARSL